MNVASLLQSGIYNVSSVNGNANTQGTQNTQMNWAEIFKTLREKEDGVSFSAEGLALSKMPQPPLFMEVDFSNMADEDLISFLRKMPQPTGFIPGVEQGVSVSDLTSEQLQSVRELLADMSARMSEMHSTRTMLGMGMAQGFSHSKMLPSPTLMEVDFTNMADEDLINFLQKTQEATSFIPGVESGISASELTSEQLQNVRELLANMSARMSEMRGMRAMQGKEMAHGIGMMINPSPMPHMNIQDMSDDNLLMLLEAIKSDIGSIPGLDNSESIEVSSLTAEQLQIVRDALVEMMQKRMEEMMQFRAMSRAVSAYEANDTTLVE